VDPFCASPPDPVQINTGWRSTTPTAIQFGLKMVISKGRRMPALPANLCDTNDMIVIHRVFRREFRLLPAMVTAVAAGDTKRSGVVAAHAAEIVGALHHHHQGEDDLLWPRLHERAAFSDELVARMEQQHQHLGEILDHIDLLLPTWRQTADGPSSQRLAELFATGSQALDEHLAEEERWILPVVAQHISQAEWNEVGDRGMASIAKPRLLVFLGYILEEASPEERTEFMKKVPPPARLAYSVIGRRRYKKESTALRQGMTG
jgi:hemerythrin-like domain-containing protein